MKHARSLSEFGCLSEYTRLYPSGPGKKMFPYIYQCKEFSPLGLQQTSISTNLVKSTGQCFIPNTKALGLVVSEKNISLCFPILAYVEHVTPSHFQPQFNNFNKHSIGPLSNTRYQNIRSIGIVASIFTR